MKLGPEKIAITLQEPFEADDEKQGRKRKPRNKPYSNDKAVLFNRLKERKHYDKPKEFRDGRRQKKKKKTTRYTDSDNDDSSNNEYYDDEQNLGSDKYADSDATVAADYTLLECFMRQAIHNFSPSSQYKKPVMYWD